MEKLTEMAKDLAPLICFAKPIINTILKPKLKKLEASQKSRKIKNEVFEYSVYEDKFQDYITKTVEKCSILNTLIFPNEQILIGNIYQPLTLIGNGYNQQEKIKIEAFPDALFKKYQRILISDSAGMGKSTLSKFICLQAITESKGIPVFIELRKLNSSNTIIQEFLRQLNSIDKVFDQDFILRLLKLGEFIIILDGYDEISNDEKENVTQSVKNFISDCSENYFLLTSRPEGALSAFGDFKITNIKGLRNSEAFELLRRFDKITNTNLSDSLIYEIKEGNNQVNDFLVNPFLVSLLYKAYSFKRDIPSRKSTFYNEVYTALYQDHDLSKDSYKRGKISKLDIHDFRLVLREFANHTAKKGEVEYEKQKAIQYISECKAKLSSIDFRESYFVEDILTTVPIFTTEGNNIKWAHKSFQDYFAAEYISFHARKEQIINHLIDKDVRKYHNIIDLVIELDPNLIRHYVLPEILKRLIYHFDNTYQFEKVSVENLAIRRMITFETKFWINKVVLKFSREIDIYDEFDRVKDYLKNEYGEKIESVTMFDNEYMVSVLASNKAIFIQLLGHKGFLGKSILKSQENSKNPPINQFGQNPELIINSNLNANYNKPRYFKNFTKLLIKASKGRSIALFVPDINFCRNFLTSIETEIESIKNNNFLSEY